MSIQILLPYTKGYNLEVHYHLRKVNIIADAVGRKSHCNYHLVVNPVATLCAEMEGMNLGMFAQGAVSNLELILTLREQTIAAQRKDKGITQIKRRFEDGKDSCCKQD